MSEELIAMQKNLGLGHKGEIIITTQERVDNNQPIIAKDIIDEEHAKELVRRYNSWPELYEACKQTGEAKYILEKIVAYCKIDDETYSIAEDIEKMVLPKLKPAKAALAAAEEKQ